jgi:glutamate/tyrosine decarboxylase-like PLP-dependent enzyme
MLLLDASERQTLWSRLIERIEQYTREVSELRVTPELNPNAIQAYLADFDFEHPISPLQAVDAAADGLTRWQVHTSHPSYFGLFNPAPTTMGIAADALVAAFNPQMAAWSHNPFAAEVEARLVRALGEKFGYDSETVDGTFASGGMEANHTAVLTALTSRFPSFVDDGLRGLPAQPVLYASSESHHSLLKAARMCGLGTSAVRQVPVDAELRMKADDLERMIETDRAAGFAPFMIAATAGTTNAGIIDPLRELGDTARRNDLWLHTDAAWGGAAAFVPELRPVLDGIELSDSITFDAHKWLSVPMGAGLYLTRRPGILERTFRIATAYMPKDAAGLDVVDPHLHSMQWSRRFIGLKLFLSLLVAGWDGYADALRHQVAMSAFLRDCLVESGWRIVVDSPLAVVCFVWPGWNAGQHRELVRQVVAAGEAWISTTVLRGEETVLRACITNYRTQPEHVEALVRTLDAVRERAPV